MCSSARRHRASRRGAYHPPSRNRVRAAAMSLSLIVPASAVYCPHDYYASTAVWYTDDGPRLQTRHWQMTIRCHNCGYADAEKEHTFPVRLELPEGCSVLVCRNLRVIGSAPVAV